MTKRLLEYDPLTGIKTFHEYDHASQKTYISHEQDCQKILDYNRTLANDDRYKRQGIKDDWYHFATVPLTVVMEWKTKYNLDVFKNDDLPRIEKLLKSSEYSKLRTVNKI
jgi:hypothetical protein